MVKAIANADAFAAELLSKLQENGEVHMTDDRVDLFANISLGSFKPKSEAHRPLDEAAIEKISKDNNFPSWAPYEIKPFKRGRYNSGLPKKQLNIKVTEACHGRFTRWQNAAVLGFWAIS